MPPPACPAPSGAETRSGAASAAARERDSEMSPLSNTPALPSLSTGPRKRIAKPSPGERGICQRRPWGSRELVWRGGGHSYTEGIKAGGGNKSSSAKICSPWGE